MLGLLLSTACGDDLAPGEDIELRQEAKAFANEFMESKTEAGPKADEFWGLEASEVFGRGVAGTSYFVLESGASATPVVYTMTTPVWIRAIEGSTKRKKTAIVKISGEPGSSWEVVSTEIIDKGPLTFAEQLGKCVLGVLLGPLVLYVFLLIFGEKVARVLTGLLALPLAGTIAWSCFGSVLAVVLTIVGYVLLGLLVAGMAARANR